MWEALAVQGGPWAILGAVVIYVLRKVIRGDLIPRSVHEDRVADYKATIAAMEETDHVKDQQISTLLGARAKGPVS